ncbi:hypothetical protein BVY03_04905 [bacterium K02(2017)]|nr:hypothetical protein BVY03_04905 [bacterium K02(2017)]
MPSSTTHGANTPVSITPVQSLTKFLSPDVPTTPMDRRRLLTAGGLLGFTGVTGSLIWNTTRAKTLADVKAPVFQAPTKTKEDIREFSKGMNRLGGPSSRMANLHSQLFHRQVRVEWEEYISKTCTRTNCTTDAEGDQSCTTESYDCSEWEDRDLSGEVWADSMLRVPENAGSFHFNYSYIRNLATQFQKIRKTLVNLGSLDMKGLNRPQQNTDTTNLNIDEFAEMHGYQWATGKVGAGKQTGIAAGIGIPSTILIFLFGKIVNVIKNWHHGPYRRYHRGYSSFQDNKEEINMTRRALLQSGLGLGAASFIVANPDFYKNRSQEITAKGQHSIRKTITDIMNSNIAKLYGHFFGMYPNDILAQARLEVKRLRSIDVAMVDRSVKEGIAQVRNMERRFKREAQNTYNRTRDIRTTIRQDSYNINTIKAYVNEAHQAADKIEEGIEVLERFFKSGIPAGLAPAMRARRATDEIAAHVSEQSGKHLWGLAGDLGLIYGSGVGMMLLSEVPVGSQSYAYNVVQGVCDTYDRIRISPEKMIKAMRDQIDTRSIYSNHELKNIIDSHIARIRQFANAEVEAQIIHAPVEKSLINDMEARAKESLLSQLDKLDYDNILELYIEKALVYYVKRRKGLKGFFRALSHDQRDNNDIYDTPDANELRKDVTLFLQSAEEHFLYDLIDGSLIQDNAPDTDWITSQNNDLDRVTNFWADKVAGLFAATQPMNAALDILPHEWQTLNNSNHERLTREDVLKAFVAAVKDDLDSKRKIEKAKVEINRLMNSRLSTETNRPDRMISEDEIAKRILLKKLQGAMTSHTEQDILFKYEPRLVAAMQRK